jgi:hypothetical protein
MAQTPETSQPVRKRPWFQFHLSTAVILMCAAGGLLWANLSRSEFMYCIVEESPSGGSWTDCVGQAYGWPCASWYSHPGLGSEITVEGTKICLDVASALCLLLLVAFTLEWLIRRRERNR